jgi:LPXTG-site transpeptidase (sortase) family protein
LSAGISDRRRLVGGGIIIASLALFALAVFFIISAARGDSLGLPSEGSLEGILSDSGAGNGRSYTLTPGEDTEGQVAQGPPPVRLAIPIIYVDAPVITMGLGADQYPEVPGRGDQVAWYNFSAVPGLNDNAVFSGHVDWQTANGSPIPGAFYRLRELHIGDEISVSLEDGTVKKYRVSGNVAAKWDDPNILRVMESTGEDVVTLITCGGSWIEDPSKDNGGNYSHRIIVRAEPVPEPAAAAATGS